jgi:hypothetical protein
VVNGGAEEDRTPDPLRARQVLSQLSYDPIFLLQLFSLSFVISTLSFGHILMYAPSLFRADASAKKKIFAKTILLSFVFVWCDCASPIMPYKKILLVFFPSEKILAKFSAFSFALVISPRIANASRIARSYW